MLRINHPCRQNRIQNFIAINLHDWGWAQQSISTKYMGIRVQCICGDMYKGDYEYTPSKPLKVIKFRKQLRIIHFIVNKLTWTTPHLNN